MAERLIWSPRARKDRIGIFEYWNRRNGTKTYSQKLHQLFHAALAVAVQFPDSGITTNLEGVRALLVRDYLIFYRSIAEDIYVLTIFDSRQNPEKLSGRLK